jgi:hypothetical protein
MATTKRRPTPPASSVRRASFRLEGVDAEITPEPTPEERAAILAALERLRVEEERGPDRWWEAGLRENVEDDGGDDT